MTNLNKVIVQGNLTRDASDDMKHSQNSDVAFGTFTLAVSRSVKNGDNWEDRTSFIKVKGFGKGYENACKHLTLINEVRSSQLSPFFTERLTASVNVPNATSLF